MLESHHSKPRTVAPVSLFFAQLGGFFVHILVVLNSSTGTVRNL